MRSVAVLTFLVVTLSLSSQASAERPITGYYWVDTPVDNTPRSHRSNIIFLNRCKGGCRITGGSGTDSRRNTMQGLRSTANITEWNKGDEEWEQLVDCVKAMYDPYNIVITDVDPGSQVEHFEAIVAGVAQETGRPSNIGGFAPFNCGVINNAISFSFANSVYYADGIDGICETVAQETAHAFGLEHEYLCTDPMTYLDPCGPKWFNNVDSSCGEYSPAQCQCRNRQNSHRILSDHFGVSETPGPKFDFIRPIPNSNVAPNFIVELSSDYYYGLKSLELRVNGELAVTSITPPYIFNTPAGIEGLAKVEVRATDIRGVESITEIEVNVGSACEPGSCTGGRVCYQNFCVPGANQESGFGATCESDVNCSSSICGKDPEGVGSCTNVCELDSGQCPEGYGCTKAGKSKVCWPGVVEETGGCGCHAGPHGTDYAGLFLVMLALAWRRRRNAQA